MKTTFIAKEGNDAKFTMVFTGEEFENAVVNAYKNNNDREHLWRRYLLR